jgi:hypothetical protein
LASDKTHITLDPRSSEQLTEAAETLIAIAASATLIRH